MWRYLQVERDRDVAVLPGLLAEDSVFEPALSAEGLIGRVDGRDAFSAHLASFIDATAGRFGDWTIDGIAVHPGQDGFVFAEWRSRATVARSGKHYANRYAGVFHVRGGQLALLREYRDPGPVKEAFLDD